MQIVKIPRINALGKKGSEKAPNLILDELKKNYKNFSMLDFEEIHVDNSNIQESEKLIYQNCLEEFERQDKMVFIGGDHSITYPIMKAFDESFQNSFLIVFDAHADCMKPMMEPSHEEWLRAIVEEGFNPKNIIIVGLRKIEDVEKEFLDKKGIKYFSDFNDIEIFADVITEKANGKNLYVSIDIDVVDPAFAPGVNYPESIGLTAKEFFYLLKRIFHISSLKAFDIVEVVPEIDEKYDFRTVKLASKVIQTYLEIKDGKK
ncbi:MAG: arginase family protein [Nanoarchaeota archaeon]|nr:arginase family protein [Nanoarchaeota archaeon]